MRQFTRSVLAAAALGVCSFSLSACNPDNNSTVAQSGTVIASGTAAIGGPFTLTDTDGNTFTQDNLKGQPSLIYFGFSYCPDVCPTALQKLGVIQSQLGKDSGDVQFVFVSVDSERDTPESLAPYISSRGFPDGLIGLSGTQEQVEQAVAVHRVYAQKVKDQQSAAEFTYDHSDLIILMNSEGTFEDIFTRDKTPQSIASAVLNQL